MAVDTAAKRQSAIFGALKFPTGSIGSTDTRNISSYQYRSPASPPPGNTIRMLIEAMRVRTK